MRVFVCVKQVPETVTRIKLNPDQSDIDGAGIKWIINPYDEFAIEEAIRFKEKSSEVRVTAITIGPKGRVNNALLTAMAMGADDSILVDCPTKGDALSTAKALAKAIEKEGGAHLIFTGKQAIDDNNGAVSQMLAELLDLPHVTVVSRAEYSGEAVELEREVEGGTKEIFKMQLPGVIAANKGLNKPRFASLPGIMKAKKKPIQEYSLEDLGLSGESKVKLTNFALPAEKPACQMLEGEPSQQVEQLIDRLQNEAKLL